MTQYEWELKRIELYHTNGGKHDAVGAKSVRQTNMHTLVQLNIPEQDCVAGSKPERENKACNGGN